MRQDSRGQTFQRARTAEQKRQRREAILGAARAISLRDGVRNVTLEAVAGEAGLAKSNVLHYFHTRDNLFQNLVAEEWRDFARAAHGRLAEANSEPGEVAEALALSFAERPLLCDLEGQAGAHLEHWPDELVDDGAQAAHEELLVSVSKALPTLGRPLVTDLVYVSGYIAGAVWVRANPAAPLRSLYDRNPEFPAAFLDFPATLGALIRALIEGLLACGERPSRLLQQQRLPKHASATAH